MAATLVQQKAYGSTADSTTHTVTLTSTPVQGNLVIVCITIDGAVTTPPSGYSVAATNVDFVTGAIYYKVAGASEPTNITFVINATAAVAMVALEYRGLTTTSTFDTSGSAIGQGSSTSVSCGSLTSSGSDLIIASACIRLTTPIQNVNSFSNSFVEIAEVASSNATNADMKCVPASFTSSTSGTYTTTATTSSAGIGHDVGVIAAFNIAPGVPVAWIRA